MSIPMDEKQTAPILQQADRSVHDVNPLPRHSVGIKVWLVHRITGLGLLVYVLAHIATMSTAMFLGEDAFRDTFHFLFHTTIFIVFDVLVLAALIIHALNGLRIMIMEMGIWVVRRKHKMLLILTIVVACLLFAWLFQRGFLH